MASLEDVYHRPRAERIEGNKLNNGNDNKHSNNNEVENDSGNGNGGGNDKDRDDGDSNGGSSDGNLNNSNCKAVIKVSLWARNGSTNSDNMYRQVAYYFEENGRFIRAEVEMERRCDIKNRDLVSSGHE